MVVDFSISLVDFLAGSEKTSNKFGQDQTSLDEIERVWTTSNKFEQDQTNSDKIKQAIQT